jgi:bacillithiol biosynthesis deacetylase BshB1
MKLDILAFGAHPDDVELSCSGTIAKEVSHGKKIGIIDLTRGELGTRGSVEIRQKETDEASRVLGIHVRENLGFRDGFFINDEIHQLEIIKKIRQYQPDIVLCNAVKDRHIDHPKGSSLVSDACFLSGLTKIETQLNGIVQKAWRPKVVYHYIQWYEIEPDVVVDISEFIDIKLKSVMCYQSQFYNPDSKEPETPITSKTFLDSVKYRSENLGRIIGVNHAEGYTVERYVGVKLLSELL